MCQDFHNYATFCVLFYVIYDLFHHLILFTIFTLSSKHIDRVAATMA